MNSLAFFPTSLFVLTELSKHKYYVVRAGVQSESIKRYFMIRFMFIFAQSGRDVSMFNLSVDTPPNTIPMQCQYFVQRIGLTLLRPIHEVHGVLNQPRADISLVQEI